MTNKQWVDAVLDRKNVRQIKPRNIIIDNAWEDLKAGKISVFEYNDKYNAAIKLTHSNT